MHEKDTLAQFAASISKTTPVQWANFMDALAGYVAVHQANLLNSPLPELPVNQGRAHALTTLHTTLRDCVAIADKFNQGKKK